MENNDNSAQLPPKKPKFILKGKNADVKIFDNGDGTAKAVYNISAGIDKEEALKEFLLSEIYGKCKECNLELTGLVFN